MRLADRASELSDACFLRMRTVAGDIPALVPCCLPMVYIIRWDEKAGLRRDAVGSQVIDALEAQEIKETGNEED